MSGASSETDAINWTYTLVPFDGNIGYGAVPYETKMTGSETTVTVSHGSWKAEVWGYRDATCRELVYHGTGTGTVSRNGGHMAVSVTVMTDPKNAHAMNPADTPKSTAELLQGDRTAQLQYIKDDNSGFQNVKLIDKAHIFENSLQVIHQYTPTEGKHRTRYDVTILVNGLPMVHIELKRRGVAVREAFNQIKRYSNDSFWADSGLFEYIQLFVISNGSDTKYYSNTTRNKAQIENRKRTNKTGEEQIKKSTKRCDSFEFTSYWADGENNVIRDLDDFTATFFAKHTILNILTRYCVFTADRELLVMRPYQIAATEAIIQKIRIASNQRVLGTIDAGGYIWHTTGSGKTLTSFKTAQLCTQLDYVDKVLFVVDRKDLDYQTVREYEKFKKGCVSSNKSTAVLTKQSGIAREDLTGFAESAAKMGVAFDISAGLDGN